MPVREAAPNIKTGTASTPCPFGREQKFGEDGTMKKILLAIGALVYMTTAGADTAHAQMLQLDTAIRNATAEISAVFERDSGVAVVAMQSDSTRMSDRIINEMIVSFMGMQHARGFTVVNRIQLDTFAAQLNFSTADLIDDAAAQSLGILMSARYVVTGTFEAEANFFRLSFWVINVETAEVISAHTANVQNDGLVASLMDPAAGLAPAAGTRPPHWGPRQPRAPDRPRVNRVSGEVSFTSGLPSLDSFGLGFGLRYERNIGQVFSMSGLLLYNFFVDFGVMVTARLFAGDSPFYFEGGLGVGWGSGWTEERIWVDDPWGGRWSRGEDWVSYAGVMFSLGIGLRLGGRTGSFFVNPFISIFPLVPGPETFRFRAGVGAGWAW